MSQISVPYSAHAPLARLAQSFVTLAGAIALWRQRARARREIAVLDARTARDIGISLSQLQFEADKPFWRD